MNLSDEQIMLLEQLTYFTDDIANDAGVSSRYKSVEALLRGFDDEALKKLEEGGKTYDAEITGSEWAAIIRAIQADEELMKLKITDNNTDVHALCFVNQDYPDEAIVAFRGTSGQEEWEDNTEGLAQADTPCQEAALDYIENLPYDNITVTGHSKGGNKAQYVTIISDKVTRCISMDGQGFSGEFLDKYYAEIEKKGGCIKNYYLEGDYVNILMFPIPDAQQICIKGEEDVSLIRNHASSAFYQYYQDKDGNWLIVCENGIIQLLPGKREEIMSYAHDLTNFLLNVMPQVDRERVDDYLGVLLALSLVPGAYKDINGVIYTKDNIMDFLMSDKEAMGLLLAYVLKYIETYNLTDKEIESLLELLGLKELFMKVMAVIATNPALSAAANSIGGSLAALIWFLIHNIHDGKDDKIIESILGLINKDLEDVWKQTSDAYHNIPDFDEKTARDNGKSKTTKVRDFSQKMFDFIMNTISDIEAHTYEPVSAWSRYSEEGWYDSLFISHAINGINTYFERVSDINSASRTRIEQIFEEAKQVDQTYADYMKDTAEGLKSVSKKLSDIVSNLR